MTEHIFLANKQLSQGHWEDNCIKVLYFLKTESMDICANADVFSGSKKNTFIAEKIWLKNFLCTQFKLLATGICL